LLEKNNIKLRAVEHEDVEFILRMENNTSLWGISDTYNPFSRLDIEQYVMLANKDIYSAKQVRFIIERVDNNKPVGLLDMFDFDAHTKRAGIGIVVLESERNKGIAGTALDIVVNYSFKHLNLHQLFCNIGSKNIVSLRLFEGKGFSKIGIKKDWTFDDNTYNDEILLQLIN
jgi:diamine N-acetyltransferase